LISRVAPPRQTEVDKKNDWERCCAPAVASLDLGEMKAAGKNADTTHAQHAEISSHEESE
jgi:hypothetical protein